MMKSGIYTITSPSGKQYVGSSQHIPRRWRKHLRDLSLGVHHSRALQNACDKYGIDSFVFKKIIVCSVDDLIMFEQRAIDVFRPDYNIAPIAGSCRGVKHTAERRLKMSLARIGTKASAETRKRLSEAHKGKAQSAELVEKRIVHIRGIKRSPEIRARMSAAMKGMGKGRVMSDDICGRISSKLMGVKKSREAVEKTKVTNRLKLIRAQEEILGFPIPDGCKFCIDCKSAKLLQCFGKSANAYDGKRSTCKDCRNAQYAQGRNA